MEGRLYSQVETFGLVMPCSFRNKSRILSLLLAIHPVHEIASDFLISMGVWERRTVASQAVWKDWSSMGDCKWVDRTGTCMELSAISAIPYSCTERPRRCKSSILRNTNCWNTSSEVPWLRSCSELIFSNPYFFFTAASPGQEGHFKEDPVLSYRKAKTCLTKSTICSCKTPGWKDCFEKVQCLSRNSSGVSSWWILGFPAAPAVSLVPILLNTQWYMLVHRYSKWITHLC